MGNPKDRFFHNEAHLDIGTGTDKVFEGGIGGLHMLKAVFLMTQLIHQGKVSAVKLTPSNLYLYSKNKV